MPKLTLTGTGTLQGIGDRVKEPIWLANKMKPWRGVDGTKDITDIDLARMRYHQLQAEQAAFNLMKKGGGK